MRNSIKKKNMNFQSVEALQQVVNVVNEDATALNDPKRTIRESAIPEVLAGAVGTDIGGTILFAELYDFGIILLDAPVITSTLAAGSGASAVVGGAVPPMATGVFVLVAPVAVLTAGEVGIGSGTFVSDLEGAV